MDVISSPSLVSRGLVCAVHYQCHRMIAVASANADMQRRSIERPPFLRSACQRVYCRASRATTITDRQMRKGDSDDNDAQWGRSPLHTDERGRERGNSPSPLG